jgi:hypothetical protein
LTVLENPFHKYGISAHDGPNAITERFRELMEDAADDEERAALRAAWEELTLHPVRRWRAALGTPPETRPPLVRPPRRTPAESSPASLTASDLTAADMSLFPQLSHAFSMRGEGAPDTLTGVLPLADDPILFPPKE